MVRDRSGYKVVNKNVFLRSGYVTGDAFILITVNKYVIDKCCCSACYSSWKCYLKHEVMREYYFKKLIDACFF